MPRHRGHPGKWRESDLCPILTMRVPLTTTQYSPWAFLLWPKLPSELSVKLSNPRSGSTALGYNNNNIRPFLPYLSQGFSADRLQHATCPWEQALTQV